MSYFFTKNLTTDFDSAVIKVTEDLKKEGFGIITEIDVKDTMRKKLDLNFRKYKILGACNPEFAFKALSAEQHIGTMLPCNVIVQEHETNRIEVSAIDPVASMMVVENDLLVIIARDAREILKKVIENL